MLQQDLAEWRKLVAVLNAHPDESLHEPASPEWKSRDIYAHLARWMELSTSQLQASLEGRIIPRIEGTDDEINARWQQEDSGLSLDEAREGAQSEFDRRIRAIRSVPADRWNDKTEALARADGAEHYSSHRRYIVVE
ncbi:MAG: maleylpyruvate isomerase N-terminal domain-containing protein [Chloroflexi bacterium]|nr:maleylpyruvate isomerase N-terminal domain-containing protein [Chloroflexota bacterium]